MFPIILLAACSDYSLEKFFDEEDTGEMPEDSDTGITSGEAPDYPVEALLSDCVALTSDVCPDNAEEGGVDAACDAWVTPRKTALDNAATMMLDDLNSGVTGIGVYTIFQARVSSHEAASDAYGETNSAAMALIPGGEDEIRDEVAAWEEDHVMRDDLDEFPLDAVVCRVSVAEFETGDSAAQFIQGHQDAGAASNDIGDAVISSVTMMPVAGSEYLVVQPEFSPTDSENYQYLAEESPYDIDRGQDEVADAAAAFLVTAAFFAEVDETGTGQQTASTLKYYGSE
jgi:hypothetical protein